MNRPISRIADGDTASAHRFSHRVIDVTLALAGLLLFAPLITMCCLLVVATSGRPVLSRQRRIGYNGRPFDCFSFRTTTDAAADPRMTAVGGILRRSGLDELPQLLNVLRGDMSIFGPRPVTEEELLRYDTLAADYLARRPGLTRGRRTPGSDSGA